MGTAIFLLTTSEGVAVFFGVSMPLSHRRRCQSMIDRGLDPRSRFPGCDFCTSKPSTRDTLDLEPMRQLGRWWGHLACVTDPDHTNLASAKLPPLDYSLIDQSAGAYETLHRMMATLQAWMLAARQAVRGSAQDLGLVKDA